MRRLFILFLPFALLFSCSAADPAGIRFNIENAYASPGNRIELELHPVFPGGTGGNFNIEKVFRTLPVVRAEYPSASPVLVTELMLDKNRGCLLVECVSDESADSGDTAVIKAEWNGLKAETAICIIKDPETTIGEDGIITNPEDIDSLVNKQRSLPENYHPSDLVRVEVPTVLSFEEVNYLRKPAADALKSFFAEASRRGYELHARSGFRSHRTQVGLYQANVNSHGQDYADKFSARPGTSEHQTGLAMDITSPSMNYQLEQSFGDTEEGRWVAENAHRYGFIIRYLEDKEEITGYSYEPWHLRYVGKNLAGVIYRNGICLEEFFQRKELNLR